jgi:CBS domain containing-hemolysin-like protein
MENPILNTPEIFQRLILVAVLIAINAFFVTIEFAIFSVRRSRIAQLVASGDLQAKQVQRLQQGIERLLSTTQLGITLSSLALGWIGERALAQVFYQLILLSPLPPNSAKSIAHSISIPLTFFLLAYLQIVFGELIPKTIALTYAEGISRFLGSPSLAIARCFAPPIWILNQSTSFFLRLFGIKNRDESYTRLTIKELQTIVTAEQESSGLVKEQRKLLARVLEFGEVLATNIMTPRTQIVAVNRSDTLQDLLTQITKTGYSRYPVIDESLDRSIGTISFKDLTPLFAAGKLRLEAPILGWMKPIQNVPESTPVRDILMMMQEEDFKMVLVVDEFGSTSGLITRQDAISALLGIENSLQRENRSIHSLSEDRFIVQAQIEIDYLNRQIPIDLPTGAEYQTLGGFLLDRWQEIPIVGDSLNYHNWKLTVTSIVGPRIDRVRIERIKG